MQIISQNVLSIHVKMWSRGDITSCRGNETVSNIIHVSFFFLPWKLMVFPHRLHFVPQMLEIQMKILKISQSQWILNY